MTDRRFRAANARVAHKLLEGQVDAPKFTDGTMMRCVTPWEDLCRAPGGARDKQILYGHGFQVLDRQDGWAFGFDTADGYVGYLPAASLAEAPAPTHRITARASHIYSRPDIKSPVQCRLSFLSGAAISGINGDFAALKAGGFIPAQHIAPRDRPAADAVAIAETFLGIPYLWGGNTCAGIDCSGLVQLAFHSTNRPCPRDSDLQAREWQGLPVDAPRQRGDIVCWKGHVGILLDSDTLLHANAHHMAVAVEPFAEARQRIAAKEFGDITTIRRP